jgi:hypothetical protein
VLTARALERVTGSSRLAIASMGITANVPMQNARILPSIKDGKDRPRLIKAVALELSAGGDQKLALDCRSEASCCRGANPKSRLFVGREGPEAGSRPEPKPEPSAARRGAAAGRLRPSGLT